MNESHKIWVLAGTFAAGALLYLLAPVLTPFLVAGLLSYLGDPWVDRLEAKKLPRTLAVVVVFMVIFSFLLAAALLLVPVLEKQIGIIVSQWPSYVDWVQHTLVPQLAQTFGFDVHVLNLDRLKQALMENWQQAGGFAALLLSSASQSGVALLAWLVSFILIPVVTFYLLRDWDIFLARLRELLPRALEPTVLRLAGEVDVVLGAFLRGQLSVMAVLASVYTLGLWALGLEVALLVGLIAGVVSFVPYLGLITGVFLAGGAAYFQFQDVTPVLWVAAIFGVGQLLEGMLLTPWLVGDKIGLHPVAVIFAVMAGGQIFGFIGVLLALPAAAVSMVLLREVHRRYLNSALYTPPNQA